MKTRGLISTKFNQRHTEELTTAHKHGYGSLLLWERKQAAAIPIIVYTAKIK